MIEPRPEDAPFRQLAALLGEQILAGQWAAGQRLPSERDLMAEHGLARETVRKAIAILGRQNLILRGRRGYGWRVADRPPIEQVRVPRGSKIRSRPATAQEALDFGVLDGTPLAVVVDPSGREAPYVWSRVEFTFS